MKISICCEAKPLGEIYYDISNVTGMCSSCKDHTEFLEEEEINSMYSESSQVCLVCQSFFIGKQGEQYCSYDCATG